MDEEYDVVVLGTGLTECILSGLLSMEGKKVLHMDRNNYYGGECASLNLSQMYERFRGEGAAPPAGTYGRERDYNIDIVPKFMMASGELVSILVHTDVTRYVDFQQVSGSFVYRQGSGICKVPSTALEAATSSLMGFFEKRRAKSFFEYIQSADPDTPSTWGKHILDRIPMRDLFTAFGLEDGTCDFIGHAMALHLDDGYLGRPALDTIKRIRLYILSMARYGKSPYIYPMYGLSELPQGFARLAAIYGGTYMLNKPVDSLVIDDATGKVCGVRSGDEVARCKAVIADPSYVLDRVRRTGRIIRAICLLDHPIPSTGNADSVQIIIPQRQLNRKYDVYIANVSSTHQVCPANYHVAMVSTIIETNKPEEEIAFALGLLGPIREKFVWISDLWEPLMDGTTDNVYISCSFDATSHFETVCDDVKSIYQRYAQKPLTIKQRPSQEQEEAETRARFAASADNANNITNV